MAVHAKEESVTSIRLNLSTQKNTENPTPQTLRPIPWSSSGYYLSERPSFVFDPLWHAGVYYVQEASSMFLEQVLKQTADISKSLRVLDLCAAPGGKSTLIQSVISSESLLVSNEVIKTRANILEENMVKWGGANVVVTNNDPKDFARLENFFDVIVIDAPCSGSGLFRRDPDAIDEWSENNVALCSQRQQRILADVWPALKHDGILIYSTCSYSKQEDEDILDWLINGLSAESCRLSVEAGWNIVETIASQSGAYGYRFWPDKIKGEGFFIAAIRKTDGGDWTDIKIKKNTTEKLLKATEALVRPWLKEEVDVTLVGQKEDVLALPGPVAMNLSFLQSALYIKRAGVTIGKMAGKDLIPDHAFALSNIINKNIPSVELSREAAIQYLRKEEIKPETASRGWALATYQGQNIGWMKVLPNRVNNYYPKEWRILKQGTP